MNLPLCHCALAFAVVALGPASRVGDHDNEFTFETPGERVSILLKDWSVKFGRTLVATQSTAGDVVALRFKDVTQKEALDRLALVVHATWQEGKGGMYLNRTDSQAREQIDAEKKAEVEALQAGQEKVAAAIAAQGAFDEAAANKLGDALTAHASKTGDDGLPMTLYLERMDIEKQGPCGRLGAKLRLLISAEDLADLPLGVRVVYSNTPTKLQRQLPEGAREALRQAIEEQATWARVASSRGLQTPRGWSSPLTNFTSFAGDQVPTRVLLCVTRLMHGAQPQFQVVLANAQGHVIDRPPAVFMETPLVTPAVVHSANDSPLILPPEAEALAEAVGHAWRTNPHPPAELSQRLSAPEKFDPLSMIVGPALVASAKARDENLVALMSDRFWTLGHRFMSQKAGKTVDSFLNLIRTFGAVTEQGGWLTVTPSEPAYARSLQADRDALGTYLRLRHQRRTLPLDQQADWAVAFPRSRESSLLSAYLGLLFGSTGEPPASEDLLRFYGGLTHEQRAQAASADGMELDSLGVESTTDFYRMVFGVGGGLFVDRAVGQATDPEYYFGLGLEPTEVLGNGIPSGARVKITVKTGLAVMTAANSPDGPTARYLTADEIAALIAQKTRPDIFRRAASQAEVLDHLRYGQSREFSFSIDFAPGIYFRPSPLIELESGGEDVVAYADLPPDFRAQVDAMAAEHAKHLANARARSPRPAASPPPER
jgi:hypothetical protein